MMKYSTLLIFLVSFSICVCGQTNNRGGNHTDMKPNQLLDIKENVSLVKLLANPEKYDGKRIQVIGFLDLEGFAIYLHKEDYKFGISENGFMVEFSNKLEKKRNPNDLINRYVIAIGTFTANEKGPGNIFAGTLKNIVRLDTWDFEIK